MIFNAIAEKAEGQSRDDFNRRQLETQLIGRAAV